MAQPQGGAAGLKTPQVNENVQKAASDFDLARISTMLTQQDGFQRAVQYVSNHLRGGRVGQSSSSQQQSQQQQGGAQQVVAAALTTPQKIQKGGGASGISPGDTYKQVRKQKKNQQINFNSPQKLESILNNLTLQKGRVGGVGFGGSDLPSQPAKITDAVMNQIWFQNLDPDEKLFWIVFLQDYFNYMKQLTRQLKLSSQKPTLLQHFAPNETVADRNSRKFIALIILALFQKFDKLSHQKKIKICSQSSQIIHDIIVFFTGLLELTYDISDISSKTKSLKRFIYRLNENIPQMFKLSGVPLSQDLKKSFQIKKVESEDIIKNLVLLLCHIVKRDNSLQRKITPAKRRLQEAAAGGGGGGLV